MRIFVSGASGNVGRTIVRTIQNIEWTELAGGWCKETGEDLGEIAGIGTIGIIATNDLRAGLETSEPDMVIDFSATPVLRENLNIYIDKGLNAVIGTTGLTDEELEPFIAEVKGKGLRWAVIPNYGLGISLVRDFIKKVRKYYPYISIIDRHFPGMANAPSGTAASLAKASSGEPMPVESKEVYPGVLGGKISEVPVFSQRLPWPGPYSEHEVLLGRKDEIIRISVEDHTSDIYMDGVFLTVKKLPEMAPGTFIRELSDIIEAS
ncbi:MAG: dihydrodipicolinate reductase C-terminal domain-containing protein [Synergistaceae bacterium]|nr:dihydrodipicolinate reductase C-terminal domain-containing protein [Synergistaceae bacterium]